MRLRNDSGYPLNSPDLGRVILPGPDVFESPVYITGCTNLDAPKEVPADSEGGAGTDQGDDLVGDEDDNPSPGMQEAANASAATEGVPTPEDEAREHAGEHVPVTPARKTAARTGRSKGDQA
jgi:hypothetical protein